jgi:hypothetical protein
MALALIVHIPDAHAQGETSLQTGYIRLLPAAGTTSPAGVAIFGWRSGGVLITEAGVPSTTTLQSGRLFADVGGPVNTGLALANPNNQDVAVSFYFTDGSGSNFGEGSFTLPANNQIAAFLSEQPFRLASPLTGTFTFNSSHPIAAIALRTFVNERNEMLITTVPVSPLGSGFGGSALLIPHFAAGRGWSTQVVLVNPGDTFLSGMLQFFGQGSKSGAAQPVKVVVNDVTASSFEYSVPPRSAFRMVAKQSRINIEIGSVRITPALFSEIPSSLAIFSFEHGDVTVSEASVAALPTANAFRMYIESAGTFGRKGSIQTGFTIANPAETPVTARLDVMNLNGTPSGLSTSVEIPAGGHMATFANELFPELSAGFRGILRISAPFPVGVAGLRGRYNERGDLLMTTTPPYDETSAPLSETDFPHFASGAGYSTQLILLSTGPAHTGSLQLVAPSGASLSGTMLQQNP